MRKIHFVILFILFTNKIFCQSFGGNTTNINNEQELNFQSVEKSVKFIKSKEINNYKIIDTINKLEVLLNNKVEIVSISIKNPEAYLIRDFENKIGTISIAIKNNEDFKVYELFSNNNNIGDTSNLKKNSDNKIDFLFTEPKLKIKELKRIKLDKFKSEELIIKFSYQNIGCPDCNQSQANTSNGYLIFDFDKLQLLKIIDFNVTTLTSQLKDMENGESFEIEFIKNYVKIKKRKYFYKDNKLIRK